MQSDLSGLAVHDERVAVSVVTPVFNNTETLHELSERVARASISAGLTYEMILVDDASPDGAWQTITSLALASPAVTGIRLYENMGQHMAVLAGFSRAKGQYVISMDADLQDLPEHIPNLVKALSAEVDVVF